MVVTLLKLKPQKDRRWGRGGKVTSFLTSESQSSDSSSSSPPPGPALALAEAETIEL